MMKRAVLAVAGFFLCGGAVAALEPVSAETVAKIQAAVPAEATAKPARPHRILVFTLTRGFRHNAIAAGAKAFELLGGATKAFNVTVSDDIGMFAPDKIRAFDAVVLMNTTGELFLPADFGTLGKKAQDKAKARDAELKKSLLEFVRKGNGLIGVHAATDCWYDWPEFGAMIGGWFNGHPWNETVGVKLEDPAHPLVAAFGGNGFEVEDEIYTFRAPWSRRHVRVLLTLDRAKTPRKGNRLDDDYALAWVRAEEQGRVFYCGFGHEVAIFENPAMLKFLLDGTQWVLGDLAADASPSSTLVDDSVDPYTGEYEGTYTRSTGGAVKATGVVWPVADRKFKVTLLSGPVAVEAAGEFDGTGIPLAKASSEDYVTAWEVAGPFTKAKIPADELLDVVFPPEDPAASGVAWKPAAAEGNPPVVDLSRAVGGGNRVAYLRAGVESSVDQEATLEIGSDDGVKAWVNGKLVHTNNAMRGLDPGADTVTVKLVKGANTVLLKVSQGGGDWAACAAVVPKTSPLLRGVRGVAAGEVRWTGRIAKGRLELAAAPGVWVLRRAVRRSPTEGAPAPAGAVVLLPYGTALPTMEAWDNRNWKVLPDGSVLVNDGDARTKRRFGDFALHVEFRVPVIPDGAGQDRGNSGVYVEDRYEIQVLDSFGLPPAPNECGAVYNTFAPRVNASLPPGQWQTYDIVFRAPRLNPDGSVKEPAKFLKVEWNGVLVHEKAAVLKSTGGAADDVVPAGPIRLQDHGHPVRYRNIWVVEGEQKP